MQKLFLVVVSIFFSFLSSVAFAEPLPRRNFEIGPEVYNYVYTEKSVAVKQRGTLVGLRASAQYHNRYMIRGEISGGIGDVDYTSGSTGSANNIQDYIIETRLLLGWDFIDEEERLYTIYSGFGYRFLSNQMGGVITSTGNWGYDRESEYFYLPLGIEGEAALEGGWDVGAYLEWDFLLTGSQKSLFSTGNSAYGDVSNDQNAGFGFRSGLKIKKPGEKYDILIEPFFRLWSVRKSDQSLVTVNGAATFTGVEPNNKTNEYGAKLAVLF